MRKSLGVMIKTVVPRSPQEAVWNSADALPSRNRSDSVAAWLGVIGLVALTAFFAHAWSERTGYVRMADMAVHQLNLHAAGLDSELGRYENLPALVQLDPDLLRLLSEPHDTALRDKVNKDLLNVNARSGSRSIFVIAADGGVLASSNFYEPGSPVGSNFADTPYYREGMRTGQARSFVMDRTRQTPEYFFAHAIARNDRILGMVVVRISLEAIERSWIEFTAASQTEKLLVIDDRDVVIMSSNHEWKGKTVKPLAGPLMARDAPAVGPARADSDKPLLDLLVERPLAFGTHLVNLPLAGVRERSQFLAEEQYMARPGWRLMTLSSVAGVQADARTAAAGAAALAALAGVVNVLGMYLLQRRRAIAQQLAARAALARAREEGAGSGAAAGACWGQMSAASRMK